MSFEEIIAEVENYAVPRVTVTGGEPMAQPLVGELMTELCDREIDVSLETSGALDVGQVDPRVVKVVDFKTPDSKESHRNLWDNVAHLRPHDQVKFVICSRADYEWARLKCAELDLNSRVADVLFSPSFDALSPTELADWIVGDRLPVRMQVQLHKLLWGDEPGR